MLFPDNLGAHLSIDEVVLTNGELYTVITNKAAHGKKGALVAIIEGTKASTISRQLATIEANLRNLVSEVTLDMSPAMEAIVASAFPRARLVTDRFHVQQLVSETLQEIRVAERRDALKESYTQTAIPRSSSWRVVVIFCSNPTTGGTSSKKNVLLSCSLSIQN
jgi:transposase